MSGLNKAPCSPSRQSESLLPVLGEYAGSFCNKIRFELHTKPTLGCLSVQKTRHKSHIECQPRPFPQEFLQSSCPRCWWKEAAGSVPPPGFLHRVRGDQWSLLGERQKNLLSGPHSKDYSWLREMPHNSCKQHLTPEIFTFRSLSSDLFLPTWWEMEACWFLFS